jgi:hypothetical protein
MNTPHTPAVDRLPAHRGRHGLTVLASLEREYRRRDLGLSLWRVPRSFSVVIVALVILLGSLLIAAVLPRAGFF